MGERNLKLVDSNENIAVGIKAVDSESTKSIIDNLVNNCNRFKRDMIDQIATGLDEPNWFYWICLLDGAGLPESAAHFSKLAEKHNDRSVYRLNKLKEDDKLPLQFIRCSTFGCGVKQIKECHCSINKNDDGEITNSPIVFLNGKNNKVLTKFNAKIMGDMILKKHNLISAHGELYIYNNGVYVSGAKPKIKKEIIDMLGEDFSQHRVNEVIYYIDNIAYFDLNDITSSPELINLKNGLFDYKSGVLKRHDPQNISIVQLNARYRQEAECPNFMKYLSETISTENILIMQEIFGYCFVPDTKAQKAFFLYGPGNTGKSTLIKVLTYILGKNNISSVPMQNLQDRFRVADLCGKLANIVSDLPSKGIEDAGMFKAVVSGDLVHAEKKFQEAFSFNPYARLLFSCNTLPNCTDRTNGFYRRLIIIPFNNIIPEEKINPDLEEILISEADGILNWALAGLKRLVKNNYHFSENHETKTLLENYKEGNSSILCFIDEECQLREDYRVSKDKLYNCYMDFCKNNGYHNFGSRKFREELIKVKGIEESRTSSERRWKGIKHIGLNSF